MKSPTRAILLLVAAVLVAWHGVILSTPHNHGDSTVPQEELACSASHPSSQYSHLHDSGRLLSPHPCAACILGSTAAEAAGFAEIDTNPGGTSAALIASTDLRARLRSSLPLLRGPPQTT